LYQEVLTEKLGSFKMDNRFSDRTLAELENDWKEGIIYFHPKDFKAWLDTVIALAIKGKINALGEINDWVTTLKTFFSELQAYSESKSKEPRKTDYKDKQTILEDWFEQWYSKENAKKQAKKHLQNQGIKSTHRIKDLAEELWERKSTVPFIRINVDDVIQEKDESNKRFNKRLNKEFEERSKEKIGWCTKNMKYFDWVTSEILNFKPKQ
jgi:hypothetical protein